jgi:glyoxylase-like metal-dependent hydrolase (beta-lactamase superfamily II)
VAFEFFAVQEHVWCLRRASYLTCSYVVGTPKGYVFIDAGMGSDGADARAALDRLPPAPVRTVLLTHWHNDHSAGSLFLHEKYGAEIFCHEKEGAKLTREPPRNLGARLSRLVPESGPLVLLKGLLNDGPSVRLSAFRPVRDGELLLEQFVALHTPGHTGGHLAYFDRMNGVLFAGDALAVVGKRVRRMAKHVTEDHADALASMRRLANLGVDTLAPGHRYPLTGAREAMERFQHTLKDPWPLFG